VIVPADIHEPLQAEHRWALRQSYRDVARLELCLKLARDLQTCRSLWLGLAVKESLLDRCELRNAGRRSLVQLRPIDLVDVEAA
jgi:hypothetical protein